MQQTHSNDIRKDVYLVSTFEAGREVGVTKTD